MTDIPRRCVQETTDPEFPLQEQQSTLIIRNPDGFAVQTVRVDGCVVPEGKPPKCCDYLVNTAAIDLSLLVELKGGNVDEAYPQLESAHLLLREHLHRKVRWLVNCSSPPVLGQGTVRLMRQAQSTYGVKVVVLEGANEDTKSVLRRADKSAPGTPRQDPPYTFILR